jgi:hypothetical protein
MRTSSRIEAAALLLVCLVLEQGCLFKKSPPKASIVIPPAPAPQPPAPLPAPPQLPSSKVEAHTQDAQVPDLPPPAAKAKSPARPAQKRKAPAPSKQAEPIAATPVDGAAASNSAPALIPNPTPSLQPILSSREIQERNQRIQKFLDQARLAVLRAERAKPDERQRRLIAQVRTFLQQAQDARRTDLVRAENLAERAEVLSRGLIR